MGRVQRQWKQELLKGRAFETSEGIRNTHHDVVLSGGSPGVSRTDAEEEARRRPQPLQGRRQKQGDVLRDARVCARGTFCPRRSFFAGFIFLPVDPATHVTNPTVAIVCFTLIQLTRRLILLPALFNRRLSSFDPTTCPSAVIASRTLIALPVWGLAGGKEFYSHHILCK